MKKCVCIFCLLAMIAALQAQSRLDSVQLLDEAVVVARQYKEIIPAQRLEGEQLQRLNSHSLADALRYFAGVQIKDYGGMGGLKTINVRNMGSHHVGVFYDGLQIGNAQNGVVDLSRFSLDDLEEVALYNGQKSEIFQAAKDFASASAVYLKTKRPVFEKGKHTHALLRYKAGSIQLCNPSFRLEHQFSDRLSITAGGEYLHSNGRYKFRYRRLTPGGAVAYDTTAIRRNSDIDAFRIESGLYGTLSDGVWQAKIYYYQSDRGLPGAIVRNVFSGGERQGDKNFMFQAFLKKELSPRYKMQFSAKFAWDYTHYLSRDTVLFMEDYVTKKMQYDNRYYQQDWYFSTAHSYAIRPNWEVSLAVDWQYNKLNADMRGVGTLFTFPERHSAWGALATAVDFGRLKMQASLLGTLVFEKVRYNTKSPDKHELAPALFVGYTPFRQTDLTLRFFYKRIFRMPTFNDLYYTQIGYSKLKPEYASQYNFGVSYKKEFKASFITLLTAQADAYYAAITDKIIATPTGSSFRWMMTNMGRVESKGIDATVAVQAAIGKVKLNTNLTYSWSKARDFTKINGFKLSSYGDQIPYTPWHSGSVIGGLTYKTWAVNYSFIYVGERYNGAVNNIERNRIEPWYTHDASLQKTFRYRDYTLKLSAEANNLLNQYYDVVLNYPMPGRNFRFILTLSF